MDSTDRQFFNCFSDPASPRSGFIDEFLASRPEQTLLGTGLGAVHDVISAPLNSEDRFARAASHDMIAHFVADTVAVVPKYRAVTGGLVRATMLANPHVSLADNMPSFGRNFVEGAALNSVGRMMLPGSRVHNVSTAAFGKGIMAEATTQFSVGVGFGGIKAGFDERSWFDLNGQFSLMSGAESIVRAGAIGGAINVPAGLLGMGVARGSAALLTRAEISQTSASLISGTTSGFSSGLVFGGIDARMRGLNVNETLEHMFYGGMAGAAGGAFISSFDLGQLLSPYSRMRDVGRRVRQAESVPPEIVAQGQRAAHRPLVEVEASGALRGPRMFDERAGQERLYELLNIVEPREVPIADYTARVGEGRRSTYRLHVLKDDAPTTFGSWDEFCTHTRPRDVHVRVHEAEGHTAKIIVKENYARLQDRVRYAEQAIPYDNLHPAARTEICNQLETSGDQLALLQRYLNPKDAASTLPVLKARMELIRNKVAGTVLMPEEIIAALDSLPNRHLVNRVVLLDEPNPSEAWSRLKLRNPNHVTAASAATDGTITFYLRRGERVDTRLLFERMRHEWAHLADYATPEESSLFFLAARIDKLGKIASMDNQPT